MALGQLVKYNISVMVFGNIKYSGLNATRRFAGIQWANRTKQNLDRARTTDPTGKSSGTLLLVVFKNFTCFMCLILCVFLKKNRTKPVHLVHMVSSSIIAECHCFLGRQLCTSVKFRFPLNENNKLTYLLANIVYLNNAKN